MRCLKLLVPLLILIFSSCDCEEVNLSETCPIQTKCFVGKWEENTEENIIIIDYDAAPDEFLACNFGTLKCDAETLEVTCEGVVYAEIEICDGIDNNCNGEIDEELLQASWESGNDCRYTQKGICKYSARDCYNGEYVCIPPPGFGEEICDGEDNDCDGEIDEDIPQEFIYSGPPETLNIGECRAGIVECQDGQEVIFGMRTPVEEICGNDDDDDCDGFTDEDEGEKIYDFLLIVDVSGSMYMYISSVRDALCMWSQAQVFTQSRFAIVSVGDSQENFEMKMVTDFTDSGSACYILDNYLNNYIGGGTELQLNAVLNSFHDEGEHDTVSLSWSTNREKRVVIFSDESLQYSDLETLQNDSQVGIGRVIDSCNENDYTVSAFISWDPYAHPEWQQLAYGCGGYIDFLYPNPNMMIQQLNYWFGEEC